MNRLKLTTILAIGMAVSACIGPPGSTKQLSPTDAEVEAYNARVDPDEQIVCRTETPVGTYIPRRVCRLRAQVDSTSDQTRAELRRVLR